MTKYMHQLIPSIELELSTDGLLSMDGVRNGLSCTAIKEADMKLSKIKEKIDNIRSDRGSATIAHNNDSVEVVFFLPERKSVKYKSLEMDIELVDGRTGTKHLVWNKKGNGSLSPCKYINYYDRRTHGI